MSRLSDKLDSGQKVITAEITPHKGAGIKRFSEDAKLLAPHVDALNVTDCQRALVRMSSLASSRVLMDLGIEPVYQLTCRDRNSIALQSDLMGAAALKIPNVLCLTGDPVKVGDSPNSKPVFELEAVKLLQMLGKLQNGTDAEGIKMNARTKFYVGAVVNPTKKSEGQFQRLEKKIEAGAKFIQTQANYDLEDFYTFMKEAKKTGVKLLSGVLILHTHEMAKYIHENIPGISVPDAVLKRFESSTNQEQTGIDFAVETMKTLDSVSDGFHLMTIHAEELIPKVLERYNG
jgi:methylenetetrahydrofolate reductase (NADPH)